MDPMPAATQPALLPVVDLPIRIRRDREQLELVEAELCIEPPHLGDARARQVRWCIDGAILPDEMVLVFGRPLEWTGPSARRSPGLILVEDVFPQPFVLSRREPERLSGMPRVPFPRGVDVVGWNYSAVLVRGDDSPWIRSGLLLLRRDCA